MAPFFHTDEHRDTNMMKIEVNVDDMSPEWLGYVLDLILEAGANDAYYIPIYMKKNRPGILLHVLCANDKVNEIKQILFTETTTLGVRYFPITVHRLERRFRKVQTQYGPITVKEGIHNGTVVQMAPEYEDCKRIAKRKNIPLKRVFQTVWHLLSYEEE